MLCGRLWAGFAPNSTPVVPSHTESLKSCGAFGSSPCGRLHRGRASPDAPSPASRPPLGLRGRSQSVLGPHGRSLEPQGPGPHQVPDLRAVLSFLPGRDTLWPRRWAPPGFGSFLDTSPRLASSCLGLGSPELGVSCARWVSKICTDKRM